MGIWKRNVFKAYPQILQKTTDHMGHIFSHPIKIICYFLHILFKLNESHGVFKKISIFIIVKGRFVFAAGQCLVYSLKIMCTVTLLARLDIVEGLPSQGQGMDSVSDTDS